MYETVLNCTRKGLILHDSHAPQTTLRNGESLQGTASEGLAGTLHQPWPFIKEKA